MTGIADLEIRIRKLQDGVHPVELTLNYHRQFDPPGSLDPRQKPKKYLSPTTYGEELFDWLFADRQLQAYWNQVRGGHGQCRIRLRIDAGAAELHEIPWEILRDSSDNQHLTAANATPFSRYLAGEWQPGSPILQRPIKMLVAIANPTDLAANGFAEIAYETERLALLEALADIEDVELQFLQGPCTLPALEEELRKGYHILHFIGHGQFLDGAAYLIMADKKNEISIVSEDELAKMLSLQLANTDIKRDDRLRLIFLSSCETAKRHPSEAFRGLAPALVKAGVPAVMAMQDLVLIKTAREFSSTFYKRLLTHGRVDLASNEARATLITSDLKGPAVPVLFMRLPNGQLFGYRGEFLGKRPDKFWDTLLKNIKRGQCTPFLGPGVNTHFLPGSEELAEIMAGSFPFANKNNLARVTQFHDTTDKMTFREDVLEELIKEFQRRLKIKMKLANMSQAAKSAKWSEHWQNLLRREIHQELADLELPLYITTNFDNFMFRALQEKWPRLESEPGIRRLLIPWHDPDHPLEEHSLKRPLSGEDPVVLHLFGTDEYPESMVLSEDDHLDFLARISSDHLFLLPTEIREGIARTSFLFLGYQLDDLELKVILRGLLPKIKYRRHKRKHVAVQLNPEVATEESHQEVVSYFQDYFTDSQIDVYWGDTDQFVADLHARWQESNDA